MTTVFVVQHLHLLPHGEEDVKLIGVYTSRAFAVAATERLAQHPGFSDFAEIVDPAVCPTDAQGFYLSEMSLDLDYWSEGYVTST
jgi:hypothetical protein